jgi:hypothetical protein
MGLTLSCDSSLFNQPVSKNIPGVLDNQFSGINYGGDSPFLTANLSSVRVECLPYVSDSGKSASGSSP